MKCPGQVTKGKKQVPCTGTLGTRRTTANGLTVTRDKYCPKCKSRFTTVEQFQEDIETQRRSYSNRVRDLENELQATMANVGRVRNILSQFASLLATFSNPGTGTAPARSLNVEDYDEDLDADPDEYITDLP